MERSAHRITVALALGMLLSFPLAAFAWLDPTDPEVITVLDTEDAGFSAMSGETGYNFGAGNTRRIKGHQDLMFMKFDLSAYKAQTVAAAELHLCKSAPDSVVSLVATTMNTDWHEGSGNWNSVVGAPCYDWRSTPVNPANPQATDWWTFPHSNVCSAAFGNYGSLVSFGFNANDTFKTYTSGSNTWIAMKLDPAVVAALILDQYGLTVTDARWHDQASGPNPAVYTKDQNKTVQPRLYIKFSHGIDTFPPSAVTSLAAQAGPENGQVLLAFAAPIDPQGDKVFGYNIRYSQANDFATATDLARWRIPRPKSPGTDQRVLVEGLTPGATYYFFVQAYDAAGNGNTPVPSVSFTLPVPPVPVLADATFATPSPAGKTVQTVPNVMRWWAASEVAKINRTTGYSVDDTSGNDNYKKANVVWDAATNTISLLAARNEMVGAQLILERLGTSLTNVSVTASNLASGGSTLDAGKYVEFFQIHYISTTPEVAIPLAAPFATTFNIPDSARNPNGKNQAVWMDVYVPKEATAGDYTGTLTVTATQLTTPVTVNLKIHVSPIEIPDYPTFLVDLNGYSNPWNWGSGSSQNDRITLRYFQACHKHRVVPNSLPYGWGGNVQSDRVPNTMSGQGASLHATSWTTFDRRYGPLFDGSAFSPANPTQPYYGPGMNTPITHFYSTFFESWPIPMLDPVYGFDATGLGGDYWYNLKLSDIVSFFATLPDLYDVYPDSYKQGLRNVMTDWVQHANDMGWTRTAFETYHNHKYSYSGCAVFWTMEENDSADDFRADGFYHQLWREGYAQAYCPDVKWHFRIDISDRWGTNYGQLDNRINYWDLGAGAASVHWPQIKYRNYALDSDKQEDWVVYSDSPSATGTGMAFSRIFFQRWAQGFAGMLPYWDNFGYYSWTSFGNPPSPIYPGYGVPGFAGTYEGALLSVRLKIMRQAEQTIELLNLLAAKPGMNRQRARDAVFAKYGNGSWDYGFTGIDEVKLYRMRADLLTHLELSLRTPGDVTGDGTVDVVDLLTMADSLGKSAGQVGYNVACDLNGDAVVDASDMMILVANWPPMPKPKILGDANADGIIDAIDLLALALSFGKSTGQAGFNPLCDLNVDGTTDVSDLLILADNWAGPIWGDINGDGVVNSADVALLSASFNCRTGNPGFNPACDLNHDGIVDVADLLILTDAMK